MVESRSLNLPLQVCTELKSLYVVERRGCLYGDDSGTRHGCFVEEQADGNIFELCICGQNGCNRADQGKRKDEIIFGNSAARPGGGGAMAVIVALAFAMIAGWTRQVFYTH